MSNPARPLVRAKVFKHGRRQVVRLPKEFQFEGSEVFVRRIGKHIVLSSRPEAPMLVLNDALNGFEPGFVMSREQPSWSDSTL
jgi:antitoxin VapB